MPVPAKPTAAEWAALMDWFAWTLLRLVFGFVSEQQMQQRWSLVGTTYSVTAPKWARSTVNEAYGRHDAMVASHGDAAAIAAFASDLATEQRYARLLDEQQVLLGATLRGDAAHDWAAMPPAWQSEWLDVLTRRRRPGGGGPSAGPPPGPPGLGPRGGGPPIRPLNSNPNIGTTPLVEQVVLGPGNVRRVELVPNPGVLGALNPWPLMPGP
jgi:hypothetical protein